MLRVTNASDGRSYISVVTGLKGFGKFWCRVNVDGITISFPLIFLKDMQYNISNWNIAIDILDVLMCYGTMTALKTKIIAGGIII